MGNVRPGPKGPVDESPVSLKGFPRDKAKRIERFASKYVRIPTGFGAGLPFRFHPFQSDLLRGLFAPGILHGLIQIARGNGKSTFAAVLAVYDLFTTPGGQVIVIASDQRQASIILNMVKAMILASPELAKRARILKDHIEIPSMGSEMHALPSDAGAAQGWNPSLLLVDELHYVTREVYEAISGYAGKRPESLTLSISTPSDRHDSIMKTLVDYGREGEDPSFFFKEFTSDPEHPIDCVCCWESANPALNLFLSRDGLRSVMRTMREPAFRRYRLAQWVSPSSAWLTAEQWQACADPKRVVRASEEVCLFFDGSISGDATALIGCTLNDPHLFLIGLWERPVNAGDDWRVNRLDVSNTIDQAFRDFRVRELACDPWHWRSEIQEWARKYGRTKVIEFPTNVRGRMGPATDVTTQAVLEGNLSHSADADLTRHVLNATVTESKFGALISKEAHKSERRIDAAVCAVGAFARATHHADIQPKKAGLKVVRSAW